jgi:hypothetical protein
LRSHDTGMRPQVLGVGVKASLSGWSSAVYRR